MERGLCTFPSLAVPARVTEQHLVSLWAQDLKPLNRLGSGDKVIQHLLIKVSAWLVSLIVVGLYNTKLFFFPPSKKYQHIQQIEGPPSSRTMLLGAHIYIYKNIYIVCFLFFPRTAAAPEQPSPHSAHMQSFAWTSKKYPYPSFWPGESCRWGKP